MWVLNEHRWSVWSFTPGPLYLCKEIKASHDCQAPDQHQTGLDPASPSVNQARTALCLLHFYSRIPLFFKLTRQETMILCTVLNELHAFCFNSHSILLLETSSLYLLCTRRKSELGKWVPNYESQTLLQISERGFDPKSKFMISPNLEGQSL